MQEQGEGHGDEDQNCMTRAKMIYVQLCWVATIFGLLWLIRHRDRTLSLIGIDTIIGHEDSCRTAVRNRGVRVPKHIILKDKYTYLVEIKESPSCQRY